MTLSAERTPPDAPALWSQVRRMLSLARPFYGRIAVALLLILFATAVQLILPLGVRELFDQVLGQSDPNLIHLVAGGLLVLFVFRSFLSFFGTYFLQVTGDKIIVDLRHRLFQHFHRLGFEYYDQQRVGDLLSRLTSDVTSIRNVVTNILVSLVINVFMLVGAAAIMLGMNWRLSLIVLAVGPLTTLVSRYFGPIFQRISTRIQDELAEATTVAQESLAGISLIKAFARGRHEAKRYGRTLKRFLEAAIEARKIDALYKALIAFLTSSSTIAIFWVGGLEVLADRLTAGALVAFLLYSQNISSSISSLSQHYSAVSQAAGASRRVFEILDTQPEVQERAGAVELPPGPAEVRFRNVEFSYADESPVLRDVSLTAQPGQTIALVGPSGAGKSTLLKLIPRFYDITGGAIQIGDQDIRDYTLTSLRKAIAIVSQEVFLFGTTVWENIVYGRLDASPEEVKAAARAANAHDFIQALPAGYETEVGERGVRLSGGQRQRISIARALLKNAPILILDEATSAVDTASESLIQEAVDRLKAERTTFVIAHREATVRHADQILVLVDGEIVERGSYRELAERDSTYRKLMLSIATETENVEAAPA